MTTQLTFQNVALTTISRNNQTYISASDLANALQYADSRAITKIYTRNQDEFTPEMSLVVNLTTKGYGNGNSEKEQRIFSLRGCHLVAMFSRTPVAKEFRKWVLDILDKEVSQNTHEIRPLEITLKVQMLDNLYYMAKNASELCHQYRKMMNDIINTLNIEYFRPSKPDYKYQLVSEMQFALDDVEVILKTHTREQTAKNIELARLRRSF